MRVTASKTNEILQSLRCLQAFSRQRRHRSGARRAAGTGLLSAAEMRTLANSSEEAARAISNSLLVG